MIDVVVIIGNSDDKLSQSEWCDFIADVRESINRDEGIVEFAGGSAAEKPFQNYCFCATFKSYDRIDLLKRELRHVRKRWRQDSIALVMNTPEFISGLQ